MRCVVRSETGRIATWVVVNIILGARPDHHSKFFRLRQIRQQFRAPVNENRAMFIASLLMGRGDSAHAPACANSTAFFDKCDGGRPVTADATPMRNFGSGRSNGSATAT